MSRFLADALALEHARLEIEKLQIALYQKSVDYLMVRGWLGVSAVLNLCLIMAIIALLTARTVCP